MMVGIVRGKMKGISIAVLVAMLSMVLVEAQQFGVVHNYAHLEGAPRDGHCATPEYFATLKAHHRRRERQLLASVDFPLHGDADVFSTGYTAFSHSKSGHLPRQTRPRASAGLATPITLKIDDRENMLILKKFISGRGLVIPVLVCSPVMQVVLHADHAGYTSGSV